MCTVKRSQIHFTSDGAVAEASDLGLRPGQWPDVIAVVDDTGFGHLFNKARVVRIEGDVVSVEYDNWSKRSPTPTVTVFND